MMPLLCNVFTICLLRQKHLCASLLLSKSQYVIQGVV